MNTKAMKTILSVAALSIAGLSASAVAGSVSETLVKGAVVPSKTVTYYRASLATSEGRDAVASRIRAAAKAVCGPQTLREAGSLSRLSASRACYHRAVSEAMSQLGADQFAAVD